MPADEISYVAILSVCLIVWLSGFAPKDLDSLMSTLLAAPVFSIRLGGSVDLRKCFFARLNSVFSASSHPYLSWYI